MPILYGIDPGTTKSGVARVEYGVGHTPCIGFWHESNNAVLQRVWNDSSLNVLNISYEWVQSYGRVIGEEVLRTAYMCGRLREVAHLNGYDTHEPTRPQIIRYFTGQTNVKKAHVRQALLDRFGGSMAKRKGQVLYGISNHMWDALAICIYVAEDIYDVEQKIWEETNWDTGRL